MAEPPIYYFAYGSNLNRSEMRVRCPGAKPLTPATLAGWRLTFRGVADIEPAHDAAVPGALWRLDRSTSAHSTATRARRTSTSAGCSRSTPRAGHSRQSPT